VEVGHHNLLVVVAVRVAVLVQVEQPLAVLVEAPGMRARPERTVHFLQALAVQVAAQVAVAVVITTQAGKHLQHLAVAVVGVEEYFPAQAALAVAEEGVAAQTAQMEAAGMRQVGQAEPLLAAVVDGVQVVALPAAIPQARAEKQLR
jgi:hypothetical protein